ncbi:MAG: hypothetical protein LBS52_00645 [Dysgonamonadaceae bacterium]|jgi:hypothetical protein|nr:hypothetical protein [Dysgonamonadaceae bacterium]
MRDKEKTRAQSLGMKMKYEPLRVEIQKVRLESVIVTSYSPGVSSSSMQYEDYEAAPDPDQDALLF